jgi:hypothetical protein
LWPRDHDPALVSGYINLQIVLEKASCDDRIGILDSIALADWINRYSEFRNDPQKDTTKLILNNLNKAKDASDAACKRYLNLANINMKIIQEAWSGR